MMECKFTCGIPEHTVGSDESHGSFHGIERDPYIHLYSSLPDSATSSRAVAATAREDVLVWLLQSDEKAVLDMLYTLGYERPHLLRRASAAVLSEDAGSAQLSSGGTGVRPIWQQEVDEDVAAHVERSILTRTDSSSASLGLGTDSREMHRHVSDTTSAAMDSFVERERCPSMLTRVLERFIGGPRIAPGPPREADSSPGEGLGVPHHEAELMPAVTHGSEGATQRARSTTGSSAVDGRPVVQFSTHIYYCDEDEGKMIIDVMRIGDLSSRSVVSYETVEASAKDGVDYIGTSGTLVFEPGVEEVSFAIELIDDDDWDTTLEFWVELLPHGLENCVLGHYLKRARIRIIDNDFFPSNVYRREIEADSIAHVKIGLFIEYFKLNWSNAKIKWRTKMVMLLDQAHNTYSLIHLFINVYLVDFVLNPHCPEKNLLFVPDRSMALMFIIAMQVIPFALLHYLDHLKKTSLGLGGTSRQTLQVALLRKFLNYDAPTRIKLRNGDLIMATTRDTADVVQHGYVSSLKVVKHVGQLVVMMVYQLVAPIIFDKPFSPMGVLPLVLFPIMMTTWLYIRMAKADRLLSDQNRAQDALVNCVDETVANFRLISDYNQRSVATDKFSDVVLDFNRSHRLTGITLLNNCYFAHWLVMLNVAVYTVVGGLKVLNGSQTLGMFLNNIRIFTNIGNALLHIYDIILDITTIMPALENIVRHMNLPLELPDRKKLNRARRQMTIQLTKQLMLTQDDRLPVDRMPILMGNMQFKFNTQFGAHGEHITQLNHPGMLRIEQGTFACLIGPTGGGRSTLLKLLGAHLLPVPDDLSSELSAGGSTFFVPSHLRVLHVSRPMFFFGSLIENLTYGVHPGHSDGRIERVRRICELLCISSSVMAHINESSTDVSQKDKCVWADVLSETQCQLLCLVRAFVANPEVLCLHKPTQLFDDQTTDTVTRLIRRFVDEKGLEENSSKFHLRRPRTCVITASQKQVLSRADAIFHVSQEEGIKLWDQKSAATLF